MIPNYLNSASPSPFRVDPSEDHDHHHDHQVFVPNYQTASSSSVSYSVFFPSDQDQNEYYHTEMHQQLHQREAENHAPRSRSHQPEKKINTGLRLSLWKNNENQADQENPVNKWMSSSKVKLMHKMKNSDLKEVTNSGMMKLEDQKQPTTSTETDHFSSNSSNTPIRVCADCNTTKTPLWRSGPKGPKSLCNACGIRQRKARRAMAAAAAAANGTTPSYETTASLKIKMQNKEKIKNNGHSAQFKKRCKFTAESSSSQTHAQQKKNGFEDFLFNLSNNLAFHRVFPQDEKEAAILLMALSCGLVHG